MKPIKIDLSENLESIELHIFADEHIGDEQCDEGKRSDTK